MERAEPLPFKWHFGNATRRVNADEHGFSTVGGFSLATAESFTKLPVQ
jgi:hypothetical protein